MYIHSMNSSTRKAETALKSAENLDFISLGLRARYPPNVSDFKIV